MRLDPQRAIIEPAKLRDYVLSPSHPVGRFKATFFAALGYSRDEWPTLADDLRTQHLAHEAEHIETTAFGAKYRIVAPSHRAFWPRCSYRVNLDRPLRRTRAAPRYPVRGRLMMDLQPLECVALAHDIPEHGVKAGDLGTIVEIYEPDGVEVEFVTAAGRTQALVTLRAPDVRKVGPGDMIAVRRVAPAA
jgi:hypothetical protein